MVKKNTHTYIHTHFFLRLPIKDKILLKKISNRENRTLNGQILYYLKECLAKEKDK